MMPVLSRAALAAFVLVVLHALGLALLGGTLGGSLLSESLQLASSGLAAFVCMARGLRLPARPGRFWLLLGLGLGCWALGQASMMFYLFVLRVPIPPLSFADVPFLAFYLPVFAALFPETGEEQPGGVDWARTLDLAQVGIVLGSAYLYFFFALNLGAERRVITQHFGILDTYSLLNLLLVGSYLHAWRSSRGQARALYGRVAAILAFYSLGDTFNTLQVIESGTSSGDALDLFYSVPFALTTVTASSWPAEWKGEEDRDLESPAWRLFPLLPPVLVLVVAGSVARRHLTLAIILIASSFVCFGARLLVTQHRERETLSQHRRLEDQLRQAMKMEAIGRLAGGMAHDFNNLLMVVTGAAELLRRQLGEGSPHLPHVQTIQKAAQDAAELTRQLLAFSRRQKLEPKVLDLNHVVREMSPMLPRLIEESIEMRILLEPTLGRVHADPGQMQQVILNLALNARDAMPRGGTLTLETKNLEIDAAAARLHPGLRPGRYVSLRVSDSGQGMDPETRARIFEPFFTTKEKGKGTGLGLATVYGIVKQSGGYVGVDSEPGRGSTFTVLLPRHEGGVESAPEPPRAAPPVVAGQTVLLVEDSAELRGMIREFLSSQGYRVLEAEGAEAALAVARRPQEAIDIVITDVVLPGMNGVRMIEELLLLRPRTPFLLMSGYADEAAQATLRPGFVVLQKPFPLELLASRVRERLAGPASGP